MGFATSTVPFNACYAVKCSSCGKTTWAGCGQHAEAVMKDVKDEDRCACQEKAENE